jgi:hypothetical protein
MNLDWSGMHIHEAIKADWKTPELLIEGSLNCAKTTVFLDKEIDALLKWPGIPILLFRWSQDAVDTKLKPAFEELLAIRGVHASWESKEKRYEFDNGSVAYCFGLKSVSRVEMFNKIRGLGVSRIGGDQVEEMEQSVAGELRGRLRPNLTATMQGKRFPFQLTFVANPSDVDFWLSKEFPVDNHVKGRRMHSLSVFDNKHLPPESVESLLRQYSPEHPKHQTMVLGLRGPEISGVPVFEDLYKREIHQRPVTLRSRAPILEAFEFGKHNPAWVYGQQTYGGGLMLLGGIRGQEMAMEDFLPIVKEHRERWFGDDATIKTCTSPMGDKSSLAGTRFTSMEILRKAIGPVHYRDNGNAADVRLALIESLSGYLRRRTLTGEESLAVNDDASHWLIASREGTRESPFLHIAFEAGYVWDPHFVSVSSKEVKQPREDDKFSNVMHCVEDIVLNFCAGQLSEAEKDEKRRQYRASQAMTDEDAGDLHLPGSWMRL